MSSGRLDFTFSAFTLEEKGSGMETRDQAAGTAAMAKPGLELWPKNSIIFTLKCTVFQKYACSL